MRTGGQARFAPTAARIEPVPGGFEIAPRQTGELTWPLRTHRSVMSRGIRIYEQGGRVRTLNDLLAAIHACQELGQDGMIDRFD
jgi:hypothetical protein